MKKQDKAGFPKQGVTINKELDRLVKPGLFQDKIDKGNAMLLGCELPLFPGKVSRGKSS